MNACEDFISTVTAGLVVAAALATFELKSVDDLPAEDIVPGGDIIFTLPKDERRKKLASLCGQVYDRYVHFAFNTTTAASSDCVYEYSVQLLRMCLFYTEFADGIREGDGNRVLRCWKYMMPIFNSSGNTNYACEAANLVVQQMYTLPPRLASQLLWGRFVNVHGKPGKNIPVDLHMEHLNKIAKGAIRFLGPNKSEKSITRIGRAIGTLSPVLDNFDDDNDVASQSGNQKRPSAKKDISVVVGELVKAECLKERVSKKRKHKKFPKPRNVLHAKEKEEVLLWLTGKLPSSI